MVRIDHIEDLEADDDWQRPKRKYRRRKRLKAKFKKGCCVFVVLIFIGLLLVGLAALAKSGLVKIPIFSDIFYQLPTAEKNVKIDPADLNNLQINQNLSQTGDGLTLTISDEQLTYLLRQTLATGQDPYFADGVQATIDSEKIEIFGSLLKPIKTDLTVDLVPTLVDNQVKFDIKSVQVGNLGLPSSTINQLFGGLLDSLISDFSQLINDYGSVQSISLSAGRATVKISPK
ncbi:MAG: hypothetical protein JW816_01885 [Candidatus Buchananbacteria bacterium]|nr:hypothetical protein [Candidatus Buchananbacteria bacterium]